MDIKCKHCGARADSAGQCTYCHKDVGSIPKALLYAVLASSLLSLVWIGVAAVFKIEFAWISMSFGFLISGVILIFAHGTGPVYQLIATVFTVVTIFFSDLFVTGYLWKGHSIDFNSELVEQLRALIAYQLAWDPYSWLFTFVGVSSGFYIWRYN